MSAGEKSQAKVTGRAIVIEWPERPDDKVLLVQIDVDCPFCGSGTIELPGHHLRAIRDLLIEFIDLHPELTGSDANLQKLGSVSWKTRGPGRPEDN